VWQEKEAGWRAGIMGEGADGKTDWVHNLDRRGACNASAVVEAKSSGVGILRYCTHRRRYRRVDGK